MWHSNPRINDWRGKRVWLIGASSGIGAELARAMGRQGCRLAVSARRARQLADLCLDLPANTMSLPLDVTDPASLESACSELLAQWGGIDLVIWLAGTYAPMRAETFDLARARSTVEANIIGPLNGLSVLMPALLDKRCGGIAFVSSVAGYRGLPKSLIYGPTKAALTNLTESLYLDLHPHGVGVWVINPGFVDTPLTAQNDFKMPALMTTQEAAAAILRGFGLGLVELDFPKRFTRVMQMLRWLPYRAYFAAVRHTTGG